ncbi:MAG: bidirectional hydrogenase complex protein HoxU [Helicobacteraceae bacterium]|jgi:bidirectional [NiFe] hydrogenase diaphorase subunit|nr:bidirectional hydrogenase complex protein HoxU [Helicobacteraceae bacterium]
MIDANVQRARTKTLTINDQAFSARSDQTILQVARENNIDIPTLCAIEGLSDIGACRLCLVEIAGQRELKPACTTRIKDGMVVSTDTERLRKHRKTILSFLFAERNHICSVCVSNAHCELQKMGAKVGLTHVEVPYLYPKLQVDASHRRFINDPNRCILCLRCVRVCDEIEGAHILDVFARGLEARIIAEMGRPWGESENCTECGKCVQVCPTGALNEKGLSVAEQHKRRGFLPYLTTMKRGR